jgi:CheY-like chemotaxis protein
MQQYNILLIDDDELFIFLTRQQLTKSNLLKRLKTATCETEAIKYMEEAGSKPEEFPDIILIDLNLNESDGVEIAKFFQDNFAVKFPDTRVFMLTSSIDTHRKKQALALPVVVDILQKPLSLNSLESKMLT